MCVYVDAIQKTPAYQNIVITTKYKLEFNKNVKIITLPRSIIKKRKKNSPYTIKNFRL